MIGHYAGLKVVIVAEPRPAYRVRPKVPSKAKGRRGTRRAWKRAHKPYTVAAVVTLELGQILRTQDTLYMRAADEAKLRAKLAAR